jgi:hypothetical protein
MKNADGLDVAVFTVNRRFGPQRPKNESDDISVRSFRVHIQQD